ncbi:nuclear receptor-interacting protein 3-like [Conger conger]|uniref:nuclear receptor-interacting protein 3-like n=1 Tax=Conger conger TaxID=82655 RepID=UPI002A5A790E|nr:nuclear receptor-interacting protein 3-like [Conger conger]
MLYSGFRKGCDRKDMEMREAAALRQQRRMKQAVQFIHKDSADLLPLDGLKKLGTSKEMQPHTIIQRRLLETNLSRCRLNNRGTKLTNNSIVLQNNSFNHSKQEDLTQSEEEDLIYVYCKYCGWELKVLIDTGSQLNFISTAYIEKLGLKDKVNIKKIVKDSLPFQRDLEAVGQMDKLGLEFGHVKVECAVTVVENDKAFISLGNRTLKSLKCVIDMEKKILILGRTEREQVQFVDGESGSRDEISPGV